MAKRNDLQKIAQAMRSAPMTERTGTTEKKKKLIAIPVSWEEKIRQHFGGTVSSYITIAIQERMQKDGLL